MRKKTHTAACLALAAFITLTGCDKPRIAAPQPAPPPPPPDTEARVRLEQKLAAQETASSRWQTIALLMIAGTVLSLLGGTVIGSRARHDSEK